MLCVHPQVRTVNTVLNVVKKCDKSLGKMCDKLLRDGEIDALLVHPITHRTKRFVQLFTDLTS